jgi:hypothetical protein
MSISGKTWTVIKALLVCGILSSLLYVGTDILAAMQYEGYSYINQAISELSAIGAPTRPLWVAMGFLYNPLVIAFGIGVWLSAGPKRSLRVAGIFLIVYGALGLSAFLFPMNLREAEKTLTDTMHIILTGVTVLLTVLFIGFGSGARGKAFRLYSIATILTLLVFGALAGMQGPRIGAGLPTPWFGVIERVCVYSPLLWIMVLTIVLLRAQDAAPQDN